MSKHEFKGYEDSIKPCSDVRLLSILETMPGLKETLIHMVTTDAGFSNFWSKACKIWERNGGQALTGSPYPSHDIFWHIVWMIENGKL